MVTLLADHSARKSLLYDLYIMHRLIDAPSSFLAYIEVVVGRFGEVIKRIVLL